MISNSSETLLNISNNEEDQDQNLVLESIPSKTNLHSDKGLTFDYSCNVIESDDDVNDYEDETSDGDTAVTTDIADLEPICDFHSDFVQPDDEGETETDGAFVEEAFELKNEEKHKTTEVMPSEVDLRHFFMHLDSPICRIQPNQHTKSVTISESGEALNGMDRTVM